MVALLFLTAACGGGTGDRDGAGGAAEPGGTRTAPSVTAQPGTPGQPGSPGGGTPGVLGPDDWPTYHRDNSRRGVAAHAAPRSALSVSWSAKLDGAVYGQPLVVGDRVYAATENNTVFALDPATGRQAWAAHLGTPVPLDDLPCGNIDPLGITGTMVYDPATRRLFAVAETTGGRHTLYGLDARTGRVALQVPVEPPRGVHIAHQQRGALTLWNGRVYVPYGGLAGDCGQYVGAVVSAPADAAGPVRSYAIPTPKEGGIWAPSGGVVDGDRLLYAVGNGAATTFYDGSDSIIALTADLVRTDFFAPSTWTLDNQSNVDLGSMSPVLVGGYVYANGKRGVGYLLRRDELGHIGGELSRVESCRALGGSAVDGDTVYLPCADSPMAVRVGAGRMSRVWKAPVRAAGSPVVGGGAVWVVDYDGGVLYALNPRTGAVLDQVRIGTAPHFASPTLSGRHAYVGTMDGVVAVAGA
jgi:PQQ enzyme repeat.